MRVAYFTHYAELYGANRSLLDLVLQLKRSGRIGPLVLLPAEGPMTARLAAEGVPFRTVPWVPWLAEHRYMGRPHHRLRQYLGYRRAARDRERRNRALLPELLRVLDGHRPELIHVNSAAVGVTALLEEHTDLPLIWHIREMPEAHYGLHFDVGRAAYGRALRKATRLIALSQAVRADLQRYTGHAARITTIYNGVLPQAAYAELAPLADERWRSPTPFTFITAGLLSAGKAQDEALRAFARVQREMPEVRLIIAGGGKAAALQELAARLGVAERVVFPGFVEDMTGLLRTGHALLQCSRNEAMGRITVEAMASGLAVIGQASGATPELIDDGTTGLLYPGGDEALAAHMLRLARDPALARRLGHAAMREASRRFTIEQYAEQVWEVYRSVLSPNAR